MFKVVTLTFAGVTATASLGANDSSNRYGHKKCRFFAALSCRVTILNDAKVRQFFESATKIFVRRPMEVPDRYLVLRCLGICWVLVGVAKVVEKGGMASGKWGKIGVSVKKSGFFGFFLGGCLIGSGQILPGYGMPSCLQISLAR